MSQQGPLKKLMQHVSSGRVPPWLGAIADGGPFRRCRGAWCVGECDDRVRSKGDHFTVLNLTDAAAGLRCASLWVIKKSALCARRRRVEAQAPGARQRPACIARGLGLLEKTDRAGSCRGSTATTAALPTRSFGWRVAHAASVR